MIRRSALIATLIATLALVLAPAQAAAARSGADSKSIDRLYRAYFERDPDPGGLTYWRGQWERGMPLSSISAWFARSPEFQARYGRLSDGDFVDLVYRQVLERGPDADGFLHWTGQLQRGRSRGWVMIGFSDSAEFKARTGLVGEQVASRRPAPPPASGARDAALWPFSSDSPWNMPIGTGVRFERADSPATRSLLDPGSPSWVNAGRYSHPVFIASPSDPVATVRYDSSNRPPHRGEVRFRVPANATAAEGTDGHLHIIDTDRRTVHETWVLSGSGTDRHARYYVRNDLHGTGFPPSGHSGTRAHGGSAIGGLIRAWELERGEIRHALALALTNDQLRNGHVWPATAQDGDGEWAYRGHVPMGTLVAIPGGVDVGSMGLSREGLAVARALQRYGAYVVDRSGSFTLYVEHAGEGPAVDRIRADLDRIRSQLRVVANNGPSSVGGGGAPTQPLAPPLG